MASVEKNLHMKEMNLNIQDIIKDSFKAENLKSWKGSTQVAVIKIFCVFYQI